jgi:hypothetical protein
MLPINYIHFDKIFLITQPDDIETIELCKQFENVKILFYNLKNENKSFDKYGALNYALEKSYNEHPESWYLIIDSDIILPNNFIDILQKEKLREDCIYGANRYNVQSTSQLLNKNKIIYDEKDYKWNNIVYRNTHPPSILGCFQLFKKKNIFNRSFDNAGWGDFIFGYDNFNIFCGLQNICYFHLGNQGKNWNRKISYFIDDVDISLNNIYYECHNQVNNIYYNIQREIVSYGMNIDINDDIWTISNKMRYDIYTFFKDKTHFKIAEIGSYKGYTTNFLSNIFSTVYAIDNSIEFMNFNKTFNKHSKNIEYVMLDLYKEKWDILPSDIEVSFIDADHSYQGCNSDVINCIKQFKNLKYIIFDDYGVWKGVKQVVDELINKKILIFETFIGLHNVPSPTGIINNVKEGIICSVNKNSLINNTMKKRKMSLGFYN